jgi:mitogen-activated protein kinase kinase
VNLREWAFGLMERDNRKSHLAPQLSPSTQDFLRTGDSPPYQNQSAEDRALNTPTSGEIPIAGTGFMSPRDHYGTTTQNRSPTRNGLNPSRTPVSAHPGLGSRGASTNSIPKSAGHSEGIGSSSASSATFTLPVRPAPSGPLPPPPPRKETPDDGRRENRRQGTMGLPPNPAYGV